MTVDLDWIMIQFIFQTGRNVFLCEKQLKSIYPSLLHKLATNLVKYDIHEILYNFPKGNGHDTFLQVTSLLNLSGCF